VAGLALAAWSLPVTLSALAILVSTPRSAGGPTAIPARWWPDWRSARTWRLGLRHGSIVLDSLRSPYEAATRVNVALGGIELSSEIGLI
jgi:hypothetical protein